MYEYKDSAVYITQCKTSKVAHAITGNMSNVSTFDGAFKPPFCLRVVKAYRTKDMQDFRDKVAQTVRKQRGL